MSSKPGILHRVITGTWNLIDQFRRAIVNILFLLILYFIVVSIIDTDVPSVNANSILLVKPVGYIVDELDYVRPSDELIDELRETRSQDPQTLLTDILKAIEYARKDDNISAMMLDLGSMWGAEPSKLQEIAQQINQFRTAGKRVYAFAEGMGQSQYYLAAHADEIMIDPMGSVFIEGYGRYNTYFKDALDKLGIKTHIFKVGTYKSAVEPYMRNDMSDEAKEANIGYLNDLWMAYKEDVQVARNLSPNAIQNFSDQFLSRVSQTELDLSDLALESDLIDKLFTRREMTQYLIEEHGSSLGGDSYRDIHFQQYLNIKEPPELMTQGMQDDTVAVIVAKGVILNGKQKAGTIGGDSTAELIRRARKNSKVKAVVIRVDSPGGSAYASEVIRREVLATKAVKPVVISMGSYAASGGYWISASADEIWASPTTITGSIGIFGMLATFEEPMNTLGISRDGIGTTQLSGAFDATKPLREDVGNAIQQSINNGYREFLEIVAEGRGMSIEAVDEIAQGRVWSGKTALELGLVDKLGNLEQAISSAATLAGLIDYRVSKIEQPLSPGAQFIKDFMGSKLFADDTYSSGPIPKLSTIDVLLHQIQRSVSRFRQMDDPNNMYAHCLCNISQ